jgi:Na+:H+ antiporter, NhaA family
MSHHDPTISLPDPPPEAWLAARRLARAVHRPIERFMHVEASSGIALLIAAVIAVIWANSPWSESYDHLWHTTISIQIGGWVVNEDLHFWINDILMAVFFLVVGLEIKREITEGALSDLQRAALPLAAAVGGMIVPAALYAALNIGRAGAHGWGVPMATDIAFAVGVLTLLGKRVPAGLRVLLLAIAIVDDIGAILVIAVFYSSGFQSLGLLTVGSGILVIMLMRGFGVRNAWLYVPPGLVMCAGFLQMGVHPTIAGVIAGLITPAKSWLGKEGFLKTARDALAEFQRRYEDPQTDDESLFAPLSLLALARREALSPARRIETALHPWVAFGIMPLFALANAGVHVQGISFDEPGALWVLLGMAVGLVVGKVVGIFSFSWIAVRLGFSALPPGVTWPGLFVLGAAGGIGFTMAIFIAELAFAGSALLGLAKVGVLAGTAVAGIAALIMGHMVLPREQPADVTGITDSELEASSVYWTSDAVRLPNTRDGIRARM